MRHDENLVKQNRKQLLGKRSLLSDQDCLYGVRKNEFHRPVSILKCCLMILSIALCSQVLAQNTSTRRKLTSFCGFKSGEVKKSERGVNEPIRARTPFRKLRDVRLVYSSNGRLQSVEAFAFIDKMKPDSGRKELDLCCKELARHGISFPEDWNIDDDGNVSSRNGSGDGVDVHITGNLAAEQSASSGSRKIRKGTLITIGIDWKGNDTGTNTPKEENYRDAITPKAGNYTDTSKLTRRAFIESVLGVTLGEELPTGIKDNCKILSMYVQEDMRAARLALPICGMSEIRFQSDKASHKLQSVTLSRQGPAVKTAADVKPKYNKLCEEVMNWLSIGSYTFPNQEFTNRYPGVKNEAPLTYYMSSCYIEEDIKVSVTVGWSPELDMSDFSVQISEPFDGEKRFANRRAAKRMNKKISKNSASGVVTEQERQIEKYMNTMMIPSVRFYSQDTLEDAIEFLRKSSKELDTRELPDRQRGLNFVLQLEPGTAAPRIPNLGISNISILELLSNICRMVHPQYTFEIKGQLIIVKPCETQRQEP